MDNLSIDKYAITGKDKNGNEVRIGDTLYSEQSPVSKIIIIDIVDKGCGNCFVFLLGFGNKPVYYLIDQFHKSLWVKSQ